MTDYTTLITSQHRAATRFNATVALLTAGLSDTAAAAASLTPAFDIDTAIGAQLDTIGLWVGIGRKQTVPVSGAFFSWNTAGLGWNQANWKGPYEPDEGITILDDDAYRVVLKAQVATNYWDGTNQSLLEIGSTSLAPFGIQYFVSDNMEMSTSVAYIAGSATQLLLELLKRGLAMPKTAGVRIASYETSTVSGSPIFALSVEDLAFVAGLDIGAFSTSI